MTKEIAIAVFIGIIVGSFVTLLALGAVIGGAVADQEAEKYWWESECAKLEEKMAQLKAAAGASADELTKLFRSGWTMIPPRREEEADPK